MRLLYSFVIDGDPRFLVQARILLRTPIGSGVAASDIVAQLTARAGDSARGLIADYGVRGLDLPDGPDGKYCNKIQQLFTLRDADFDVLVACDTDLAVLHPLDGATKINVIRAKRVNDANPPFAVLEEVRAFLGVTKQPTVVAPSFDPAERTYALNCNGGVLMIPRQFIQPLGDLWLEYAAALTTRSGLLQRWVNHIDQVTWALAMMQLELPFEELPLEYNFSTVLADRAPAQIASPLVLHHHNYLDKKQRLRLCGNKTVDQAIKRANAMLN